MRRVSLHMGSPGWEIRAGAGLGEGIHTCGWHGAGVLDPGQCEQGIYVGESLGRGVWVQAGWGEHLWKVRWVFEPEQGEQGCGLHGDGKWGARMASQSLSGVRKASTQEGQPSLGSWSPPKGRRVTMCVDSLVWVIRAIIGHCWKNWWNLSEIWKLWWMNCGYVRKCPSAH